MKRIYILTCIFLGTIFLSPGNTATVTHLNVSCAATSTQVSAASTTRKVISLQNISGVRISIAFGQTAVVDEGHVIPANDGTFYVQSRASYGFFGSSTPDVPTDVINCISASGTNTLIGYVIE